LLGPVTDDLLLDLASEAKMKALPSRRLTGSSFKFSNIGTLKKDSGTNSVLPCHNSGAYQYEQRAWRFELGEVESGCHRRGPLPFGIVDAGRCIRDQNCNHMNLTRLGLTLLAIILLSIQKSPEAYDT
jgi:hypothetical protein